MAKLLKKHLDGTIPGDPVRLLKDLTQIELDEMAATEGYEHFFEGNDEPKSVTIEGVEIKTKEDVIAFAELKDIKLNKQFGFDKILIQLTDKLKEV